MSNSAAALQRRAEHHARRDTNINLRLPYKTRELIDAAASAVGQTRTEFVVTSAKQHAIDVLLDQVFFDLTDEQAQIFISIIDNPPEPNEKLRELMKRKAPWSK
jgi:uncharacterized protein (DUF1778 family)